MQTREASVRTAAEKRALLQRLLEQQDAFPLSFGQRWVWLLQQLAPGSAVYNFPVALRITSPLDAEALERALQEVVNRHPAFRTIIILRNSQPVQTVQGQVPVAFELVDASGWSAQSLRARVSAGADRPFDLTTGPLFRSTLFRQSSSEAVLLLVWHHMVLDGWSLSFVLEDLAAAYAAYAAGRVPVLSTSAPYAEFVQWQQHMVASEEGARHAESWLQQLERAERLDFVSDAPRPAQRTFRGGSVFFSVGQSLTRSIRDLAASEGTTPFVVLLGGFEAVLHRITGQESILVSFPVAGRTEHRFARTAGYFVNQLSVIGEIGAETTFRQLVAQTHAKVLTALDHQDYPLSLLPRSEGPGGHERPRFSEVMFVLQKSQGFQLVLPRGSSPDGAEPEQDASGPRGNLGGLQVEAFLLDNGTARYDFELQMFEQGGALLGWLQYDLDLFEESTARRLVERFQRMLAFMPGHMDQPVSAADVLSGDERQRLLDWNRTQRDWEPGSVAELFERQVRTTPDVVAALCGHRHLTFAELNVRANRIAQWLRRSGARPQDIVGLCVPRSLEMLVALFGIIKAGCIYLPLDPTNPVDRLKFMVKDSGAEFVITSSETCGRFRRSSTRQLCLHCDSGAISECPDTPPSPAEAPILYVVYTSGSTGEPKGVAGTQRGALNRFHWMWDRYPFAPGEVCAQVTNLGFVDAVWEILGPILRGTPTALIPDEEVRDTVRLVEALGSQSVTRITLVPSLLRVLLQSGDVGRFLPRLRYWSCSGEALEPDLARRFAERVPHGMLLNLYGCSEAAADTCYFEIGPKWNGHRMPIGRPIANTQVYLLNQRGNLVPPGSVGEIYVGGAGLAAGYLGKPQLTAEQFGLSPFAAGERLYRTGDLGRYLPDGNIEYFGRADQQVKIRGHRVELGEVEVALRSHPDVESAAVEGVREASGDRVLVAYVVTRSEELTDGELRAHLAGRLPNYMFPSRFIRIDTMPLTATGKVNRRALPPPGPATRTRGYVAPRNQTERSLAEIWGQVLNVPQIGIEDDFFEWGGHSILALQAASQASQVFKRLLPVDLLVKFPTVASMATYLDGDGVLERRHQLVAVEPRGSKPPLFWIPGGAGTPVRSELKALSVLLGPTQPLYGLASQRALELSDIESVPERARGYVETIRELQSEGPYYLTGFCLGGVVAFEAAQQLKAGGQQVAFLGLVNSWMPAKSVPDSQWLLIFLQRVLYHARAAVKLNPRLGHRYILGKIRAAQQALRRFRQAESGERPPGNESVAGAPPGEDAVLRATIRLASRYVPQAFEGRMHVFVSEEPSLAGVSRRLDPRQAWKRVCENCEMIQVRGGHLEMLDPPLVDLFAKQLRDVLHAAQTRSMRPEGLEPPTLRSEV